jgi:hypothetical protein
MRRHSDIDQIVGATLELNWQDLVVNDSELFRPSPGAAFLRENIDQAIETLPWTIQQNRNLAALVANRFIDQPQPFAGGALGKVGDTNVFVAEKRVIPNYDMLHRVIMSLLSSRYGCLMRQRIKRGDLQELYCRDGRKVQISRREGPEWIQFTADQFDATGAKLIVRGHAIARRIPAERPSISKR